MRNNAHFVFKTSLIVIAVGLDVFLSRIVLSEYYCSAGPGINEKGILLSATITDENARYHYLLGSLYYNAHDKQNIQKAIGSYLLSLSKNPVDGHTWLEIARAYRDCGKKEYAEHAIEKAVTVEKSNPEIILESAVYYLLENRPDDAMRLFKRYIYMAPDEQESVYSICYSMRADPLYMLDNLIPREYGFCRRYFYFLLNNGLLDESREAWSRLKSLNPGQTEYIEYCDFLINAGEIKDALTVWKDYSDRFMKDGAERSSSDTIRNGGFEADIVNGGFDWRIGEAEGVKVYVDSDVRMTGSASLTAHFDGAHNPDIYLAQQVVPVEAKKKYRIAGYIKTEDITTRSGIFLEVSGDHCNPFTKRTEAVTGTNSWRKMEIEFVTPGGCNAIRVGIRRERSDKFDNKIGGDAWIDTISMTALKEN